MTETLEILLVVLALAVVAALLRQLELVLMARGWNRAAHAIAVLRSIIPDAPTARRHLVAMRRGREPLPTLPEVADLPQPPPEFPPAPETPRNDLPKEP